MAQKIKWIWPVLYIVLDMYPFFHLRYLPFRDKLRLPMRKIMAILLLGVLLESAIFFALLKSSFLGTLGMQNIFRTACMVLFILLSFLFIDDKPWRITFVFLQLIPFSFALQGISNSLVVLLFPHRMNDYIMLHSIFRLWLTVLVLPCAYWFVLKKLIPLLDIRQTSEWFGVWVIPGMISLLAMVATILRPESRNDQLIMLGLRLMLFFINLIVGIFLLKSMQVVQENTRLEAQVHTAQVLLHLEKERYDSIAENAALLRAARHDLRHQMTVLNAFVQKKDTQGLEQYLQAYMASLPADTTGFYCQNTAADAVCANCFSKAKAQGIRVVHAFQLPKSIRISDIDLCIILGNCLEKALEACAFVPAGERYIHAAAKVVNDSLTITIDNSCDGQVVHDNTELLSRKRHWAQPGTGLYSVSETVKKYAGLLRVDCDKNEFQVSILLPLL